MEVIYLSVTLKTAVTIGNIVKQIPGATVKEWIHEGENEKLCIVDENNCYYELKISIPKL